MYMYLDNHKGMRIGNAHTFLPTSSWSCKKGEERVESNDNATTTVLEADVSELRINGAL